MSYITFMNPLQFIAASVLPAICIFTWSIADTLFARYYKRKRGDKDKKLGFHIEKHGF